MGKHQLTALAPVMSRGSNSGMTLLEICLSLLILGIVFGVAIPFSQEIFRKHPLEVQLESFEEMVRTAMTESQSDNRTARITFTKSSIRLYRQPDEASPEDESNFTELLIPAGAKYQIQLWPDYDWIKPDDENWNIPAKGLILPLTIKWSLEDSWLAASIDPMTGELKDVTYELN